MYPTVFLSSNNDESKFYHENLLHIMESAGMEVIAVPENGTGSGSAVKLLLEKADCSVHILSRDSGVHLSAGLSLARLQLDEARNRLHESPDFKIFIWYPPEVVAAAKDPEQEKFINEIRNTIEKNMIFSNAGSPIQLVDDIRHLMVKEEKITFDVKEAEVFLIFNEMDEFQAAEIIDMVGDIIDIEKLNIIQDSDIDYSEYCSQQIGKSKLAVVYFKETSDWALPFTQQVWKKIGGATSHTPILLIGDDDPDSNLNKKLKAPKIISLIVAGALIPLEIKVQYDKVVEDFL